MNQSEINNKISNHISNGTLSLKYIKTIVPIPENILNSNQIALLYVYYNTHLKNIDAAVANGYKNSLKNDKACGLKILEKLPVHKDGYTNLKLINSLSDAFGDSLKFGYNTLGDYFITYMGNNTDYYLFNEKLKAFYKYMPFLSVIFKNYVDNKFKYTDLGSYDDDDIDGFEHEIIKNRFKSTINEIAKELNRIKLID